MKLEKITNPVSRWYEDGCGVAHGLELLGERWTLLVVRELMFGPRRFGDLRASLPGLSANVLTQRLAGMEASRLVVRRKLPPPASVQVYDLTDWGREAESVINALGRWALRSPGRDPGLPLTAASVMLSFRALFDAAAAEDAQMRLGFRFRAESFVVEVLDGTLTVSRAGTDGAEVVISGSPAAVARVVHDGAPASGLAIEGRGETFERFASFFEQPTKAV